MKYDLFYGSLIDLEPELILQMYEYQHALGKRALFTPRIITFECLNCPKEIQDQHCISKGEFCFTPPTEEKAAANPLLTDELLIKENLRERCVYKVLSERDDQADDHLFFNYLYYVGFECLG